MICLNIILPFFNKAATFESNLVEGDGTSIPLWVNIFYLITSFFVLMIRLVIGSFLGYAIHSIWKQLKQSGDNSTYVDIRILALHASAFGLYMISIIANFIFLTYFYLNLEKNSAASIASDMFVDVFSFIA